jgi:hypothetical protein
MPEYFDGVDRREFENPWLRWPIIVSGIVLVIVGFDVYEHNLPRGVAWIAAGAGMALYGLILVFMRHSQWRWFALVTALVIWFGGLFGVLRFTL